MKGKKGQVGFDTAKAVMLGLMFIAVVGFTIFVLMASLKNSPVSATTGSGSAFNETLATNVTNAAVSTSQSTLEDIACSFYGGVDAFSNWLNVTTVGIGAGNYTLSGCTVQFSGGTHTEYNNSVWQASYNFTYDSFSDVSRNVTGGVDDFFNNTGTWFSLLSVVVIILIISIVIFAVNRFGRRNTGL